MPEVFQSKETAYPAYKMILQHGSRASLLSKTKQNLCPEYGG